MPRNKKDLTLKGAIEMPLNFRERQSVIKELANQHVNGTAQLMSTAHVNGTVLLT